MAKASLQELLVDYEDFLRVRGLEQWPLEDPRTKQAQEFCTRHNSPADYMEKIENRSPEAIANIAITLIHQTDVMLRRLIESQQVAFKQNGGIKEQMTAARLGYRQAQQGEIARLTAENERLSNRVKYLEDRLRELGIDEG